MARIRFKTTCITASHGAFVTGDLLTCSDDFASHLVNDCGAAEFVTLAEDLAKNPIETLVEEIVAEVDAMPKRRGRPPKVAE